MIEKVIAFLILSLPILLLAGGSIYCAICLYKEHRKSTKVEDDPILQYNDADTETTDCSTSEKDECLELIPVNHYASEYSLYTKYRVKALYDVDWEKYYSLLQKDDDAIESVIRAALTPVRGNPDIKNFTIRNIKPYHGKDVQFEHQRELIKHMLCKEQDLYKRKKIPLSRTEDIEETLSQGSRIRGR